VTSEFLSSFAPIVNRYDAFILDIWGVIHDGQKLYPHSNDCLKRLREAGKKVVLMSNAPRRASVVIDSLRRMGVSDDAYDAVITSGETAYQWLAKADSDDFCLKGNRYIYVGLEKDRRILEGLAYEETDDPSRAGFLLLSHSYFDNQPMAELEPLLTRCLKAKLPALCINPDTEIVRLTGEHVYCAGLLAAEYAKRGGQVIYFGKPHPTVYAKAFEVFSGIGKDRIAVVGDNLATDIAGGLANGLKSALVTGGILKATLAEPGTAAYEQGCMALFEAEKTTPNYVLAVFNW
jgi:HAD superfamily hydrolase (TIGR01459 family)